MPFSLGQAQTQAQALLLSEAHAQDQAQAVALVQFSVTLAFVCCLHNGKDSFVERATRAIKTFAPAAAAANRYLRQATKQTLAMCLMQ
ncbi:hypothetical protein AWZ03_003279 [Drosophila navojoa]|uniref:Uncharacterized protein n=1 Tax=Drosophila navojoa TaxID=7232 RepID=A0A484BNX9_DRONA|nr:hypothetical protein AWZ03_003279 [Drosophila navojoa]